MPKLRSLLAWARTAVSMIGFGFTVYNFNRGFLQDLSGGRGADSARDPGLALVASGTAAMVIALWNYWSINRSLELLEAALDVPVGLKRRWVYSYVLAAVLMLIGLVTILFMPRVIWRTNRAKPRRETTRFRSENWFAGSHWLIVVDCQWTLRPAFGPGLAAPSYNAISCNSRPRWRDGGKGGTRYLADKRR